MDVAVATSISTLSRDSWDSVVRQAGAPAFYRHDVLHAYERAFVAGAGRACYLLCREPRRREPGAAVPAYLLDRPDPFGVLAPVLTERLSLPPGAPVLVTHAWHWYDTYLPAVDASPAVLRAVLDALSGVARDAGAAAVALVNVAAEGSLPPLLRAAGFHLTEMSTRYCLDLTGVTSMTDYLGLLRGRVRRALGRHVRRAEESGVTTSVLPVRCAPLEAVLDLCARTALKHDNGEYYARDRMRAFVTALGEHARVVCVEAGGSLIAASICLLDDRRFHLWAGGADYDAGDRFSPNYVLFHREVEAAIASGRPRLEAGRTNHDFKTRHGLRPLPLLAAVKRAC